MNKNFLYYNKIVGVLILFLYFSYEVLNIKFLSFLFSNKIAFTDSWWYWPIKYIYDVSKDFFYPPVIIPGNPLDKILAVYNWIMSPRLTIPYVHINDVETPPTEAEITQEFFNRLFVEGTLVYYIYFIGYIFFSSFLFWGVYLFLKTNRTQLFSINLLKIISKEITLFHYTYILIWFLLQIFMFQFDLCVLYEREWYYGLTTVLFCFLIDLLMGTFSLHNSVGRQFNGGVKEQAFWFFKGQHLEFFSSYCVFVLTLTFLLDFLDLLPEAN